MNAVPPPFRRVSIGTVSITKRTKTLVKSILKSQRLSFGEISAALETEFANLHNTRYAILSNSGTDALRVALHALKSLHGWRDGAEVILPVTTFVATANVVYQNRLTPVFVDVLPDTFNIDPVEVDRVRTVSTRAVIPVHLLGQPSNISAIRELSRHYHLVEDSCETMLAEWAGRRVGGLGDIGCFSLYVAHLITAGVGGVSTTDNPDYAAKMRSLINHGLTLENLNVDRNFAPQPAIGRRFTFDEIGYSSRLTEFEAAVALAQVEDDPVHKIVHLRRRNAAHLNAGLQLFNTHWARGETWLYSQATDPRATHSYMMFGIVISPQAPAWLDKPQLMGYLNARGVETRDIPSLLGNPVYAINPDLYPVSKHLYKNGLYVGCHQNLNPEDIQHTLNCLYDYAEIHKEIA